MDKEEKMVRAMWANHSDRHIDRETEQFERLFGKACDEVPKLPVYCEANGCNHLYGHGGSCDDEHRQPIQQARRFQRRPRRSCRQR